MKRFLLTTLILLMCTPVVWAKARYAPKPEMITKSEAIAIVHISNVDKVSTKGKHWTYGQAANAEVKNLIKGNLPKSITLYGDEDFICAQCHFGKGDFLVFLRRDGEFLVGSNWHLSVRPIIKENVEWYTDNEGIELKKTPLSDVLKDIETHLESPTKK